MGSEWVGKPEWPVLKSAKDVEEEARAVVDQSATQARDADEGSQIGATDTSTAREV